MSDLDGKTNSRNFKKRAHRPWKSSLLETTIQESSLDHDNSHFDFNLDLESMPAESMYAQFDFTQPNTELPTLSTDLNLKFSQLQSITLKDDVSLDLKSAIKHTEQQKNNLQQQIHDKSSSSLLLGGFFQPQQLGTPAETQGGRKMNYLISDLKNKEQELNSLTNNLKVTEAMERVEQSELIRRAEEQARITAETRMRQVIEQANIAAEQGRLAMDQANQAALAHREEEKLRKLAEDQIKEAELRAVSAEITLNNERSARIAAEEAKRNAEQYATKSSTEAAQQATEVASLRQTIQEITEQLERAQSSKRSIEASHADLDVQFNILSKNFQKVDSEHKQSTNRTYALETQLQDLLNTHTAAQHKIAEVNAQVDKLKSIIAAEQELRRAAEKRAQDLLAQANKSEQAKQAAEQQLKITDERAKRAVEHASRTVMHLLNAPVDNEYNMKITSEKSGKEKIKIRMPAAPIMPEPQLENDDYSF